MAGREDFGIVRSRLLTDPRARVAASSYLKAGLTTNPRFALSAVVGHVAMLGLWAMRETDDGILPGDGLAVTEVATLTSPDEAAIVVQALRDAELLREATGGLYLVGFRDCYLPILDRRTANAEHNRLARLEAAQARQEAADRVAQRKAQKGVTLTSPTQEQDVSAASPPCKGPPYRTGRYVPSGPDGTERNGRALKNSPPGPVPVEGASTGPGVAESRLEERNGNDGPGAEAGPVTMIYDLRVAEIDRRIAYAKGHGTGEQRATAARAAFWRSTDAGEKPTQEALEDAEKTFAWVNEGDLVATEDPNSPARKAIDEAFRVLGRRTAAGRVRDHARDDVPF